MHTDDRRRPKFGSSGPDWLSHAWESATTERTGLDMGESLSRAVNWFTRITAATLMTALVAVAVGIVVAIGFGVDFSPKWHSWVHSGCGLIAVFMLFVLHHTESQQTNAILLKLDELVQADDDADDDVVESEEEELDDQENLRDRLHRGDKSDGSKESVRAE